MQFARKAPARFFLRLHQPARELFDVQGHAQAFLLLVLGIGDVASHAPIADKPPLRIPDWCPAYRTPIHVTARILVCNHKVPKRHPRLEHGLVCTPVLRGHVECR